MKKAFFLLTILSVFGSANLRAQATPQQNQQPVQFTVFNQQSDPLGTVTIVTDLGNSYLNVQGNSTDTTTIADPAMLVTIDGQTIPQGVKAYMTLATGKVVMLIWVSQNSI